MTLRTRKSAKRPRMSEAQMETHRHNSFIGHAVLTRKNMDVIAGATFASADARALAVTIRDYAELLEAELRKGRPS